MKKTIAVLLAVCMAASLLAVPAFAASPGWDWSDYFSRWKSWVTKEQEPEIPAAQDAPEAPVESEAPEETEVPEETEPVVEYTIRYDANGGYFWSQYASPAISNSKSYKVAAGDTHKVISAPRRTSYTFAGWMDEDGNLHQPGDKITPTGDLSLKAQWTYNG